MCSRYRQTRADALACFASTRGPRLCARYDNGVGIDVYPGDIVAVPPPPRKRFSEYGARDRYVERRSAAATDATEASGRSRIRRRNSRRRRRWRAQLHGVTGKRNVDHDLSSGRREAPAAASSS